VVVVLKKVAVFEAMRSHRRTNGSRLARARTSSCTLLSPACHLYTSNFSTFFHFIQHKRAS
jgi:hypothetical protein